MAKKPRDSSIQKTVNHEIKALEERLKKAEQEVKKAKQRAEQEAKKTKQIIAANKKEKAKAKAKRLADKKKEAEAKIEAKAKSAAIRRDILIAQKLRRREVARLGGVKLGLYLPSTGGKLWKRVEDPSSSTGYRLVKTRANIRDVIEERYIETGLTLEDWIEEMVDQGYDEDEAIALWYH